MRTSTKAVITGAWLAVVIPQIFTTYGSHPDGWQLARNARLIWEHGSYFASRGIGFPLHEILVTPMIIAGDWVGGNLLSVMAGLAFLIGLFKLADLKNIRHPLLVIAGLAFLPIVIHQATSTIDFMFLLTFCLWSYICLIQGRYYLAGVLIGIACGFRISACIMIGPTVLYVWQERREFKTPLIMFLIAAATGVLAFSPALLTIGIRPFGRDVPFVQMMTLGLYQFLRVFGVAQIAVLGLSLGTGLWFVWKNEREYLWSPHAIFHGANIIMWTVVFFTFSIKSEYWILAVPSVIFAADRLLSGRLLTVLVIFLLSYHVVELNLVGGESGKRYVRPHIDSGYTVKIIQLRQFMKSYRAAANRFNPAEPTLIMFGKSWVPVGNPLWEYDKALGIWHRKDSKLYMSALITVERHMRIVHERGIRMYAWRGDKAPYMTTVSRDIWGRYVSIVDDLGAFLGQPIQGRWIR